MDSKTPSLKDRYSHGNSELRKILKHRYKKLPGELCFYCGDIASGYDHVPPIACMTDEEGYLMPACWECNSWLHTYTVRSLNARRAYILKRFLKKYKKLLDAPKWTDKELQELAGDMRMYVIEGEILKRKLKWRLHLLKSKI